MKPYSPVLSVCTALFLAASAPAQPFALTNLWRAAPGDPAYPFLAADNNHRGLAYNPVTTHVLVASRTGGNDIHILDSETGAVLGKLPGTGIISQGLLVLIHVGVGADGAIYANNLTDNASISSKPVKIYRWADETDANPVVVYSGDPFAGSLVTRIGDTMTVRGAGLETEILMATSSTNVVLFRPGDSVTNFVATPIPTDAPAQAMRTGLTWGAGRTFWGKYQSQALRRMLLTEQNTAITLNSNANLAAATTGLAYETNYNLLAVVNYSAHNVTVYDATDAANLVPQGTNAFTPGPYGTNANNGNAATAAAFGGDKLFALDANNGVVASRLINLFQPVAPTILSQPVGGSRLEGGSFDLNVVASGPPVITYQWFLNGAPLPDATNAVLALRRVGCGEAGLYTVVVSNPYGSTTSSPVQFRVTSPIRSDALTPLWSLAPGVHPAVTADNAQRGLAYNPASGNVLVVTHSPNAAGTNIAVFDGETGAFKHYLNTNGVAGGYFALNMVDVDAFGVVYACNLTLNGTTQPFRIYRWENDGPDTEPTVAYVGDPGSGFAARWGDSFSVKGADLETLILAGCQTTNFVTLFATLDTQSFYPTLCWVTNAAANAFRLSLAWAEGYNFWAKASGGNLIKVQLDPGLFSGSVLLSYSSNSFPYYASPVGVDPDANLLAAVVIDSPQRLCLYDLSAVGPDSPPLWMDTELFPADNPNGNGTGAADFAPGRLYALDSNSGLLALALQPRTPPALSYSYDPATHRLRLDFVGTLQAATNIFGPWENVPCATSPHTVDVRELPAQFFRAR